MKCGYLLQFSVENYERSVSYYIGHNKRYVQGVAELREYCSCGGYGECPVALWRDSMTRGDVALPVSGAAGREIGEECSSR